MVFDNDDEELSRIRKKVKKKKKHLPTSQDQQVFVQSLTEDSDCKSENKEDDDKPIQKFKVEACNSVGDFSTLWIKTSSEVEAKSIEQFRESVRLPAPTRLPVSNLETETKIVLPIPKTYVRDNSRNSVYLTVKKTDENSSRGFNQSKMSNDTGVTIDELAKIDSKDIVDDTSLEVKNISDTLAVSLTPKVRKSLNADAKNDFLNNDVQEMKNNFDKTCLVIIDKTDNSQSEKKIETENIKEEIIVDEQKSKTIKKSKLGKKIEKNEKSLELEVSSKDKLFSKENTPRLESPIRAKLASKDSSLKSHPEGVSSLSNEIPTDGIKSPELSTNDTSFSNEKTQVLESLITINLETPEKFSPLASNEISSKSSDRVKKYKSKEKVSKKIIEKILPKKIEEVTSTNEFSIDHENSHDSEVNSEIDFWSEIKSEKKMAEKSEAKVAVKNEEIMNNIEENGIKLNGIDKKLEPLDLSRIRESMKSFESPSLPTSGISTPLSEISQTNFSSEGLSLLSTDTSIIDEDDGLATPTNESITIMSKWNKQDNLSNLTDLEKDLSTLPMKKIINSTTSSPADSKKKKKKIIKRKKSKSDKNDVDSVKSSTKLSKKKGFTPDSTMKMSNARSSPRDAPCRPSDLMRIFYTTPRQLMTATPRDLRKVRRAKVKKRKPPPRNASLSSDSTGSTTSTQSTNTSTEEGCNSMDELEQKRMASTRSNDSGFDGSPRLSSTYISISNFYFFFSFILFVLQFCISMRI